VDNDSKTSPASDEPKSGDTATGADSKGQVGLAADQSPVDGQRAASTDNSSSSIGTDSVKGSGKNTEKSAADSADKGAQPPQDKKLPDAKVLDSKVPEKSADKGRDTSGQSPSPQKSSAGANQRPAQKGTSLMKKLVYLIIFIALLAAGYYGWQHYGEQLKERFLPIKSGARLGGSAANETPQPSPLAEIPVNTAAGDTQADSIASLRNEINSETERVAAKLQQLETQVSESQLRLNNHQERLQALSTTTREDWLLAEAEYLLRLANQRILTERQTANALSLMVTADDILKEIDDPDLFVVRKALAADITRVKLAGVVDREGIYLRLDALIAAIPTLRAPLREPTVVADNSAALDAQPWYVKLMENAKSALVKMSGIVRVERVDVPLEPVLLPSEQQLLHLNLRMALEQAQLALMREEQKIYSASLGRARGYVEQRLYGDASAAVFADELRTLAEEAISQPVPEASASIHALQDYVRIWHNRYSDPEQDKTSADSPPGETFDADTGVAQ